MASDSGLCCACCERDSKGAKQRRAGQQDDISKRTEKQKYVSDKGKKVGLVHSRDGHYLHFVFSLYIAHGNDSETLKLRLQVRYNFDLTTIRVVDFSSSTAVNNKYTSVIETDIWHHLNKAVQCVGLRRILKQVCAAEMAVRYAALCASRKVHVCHCNLLGGAT